VIARLIFLGILTASVYCAAEPALDGVRNFAEVDEHVYRGGQPTAEGFANLAKKGIKTVIDLRSGDSRGEAALVKKLGMKYVHVPMGALSEPRNVDVERVLSLLDPPASSDWPVFIHCMRGKDRTGVVIACYRISRAGWNTRKALDEARNHGLSWLERSMWNYILHYEPPKKLSAGASP
jgi:protein tyrosine/serine phosphatase